MKKIAFICLLSGFMSLQAQMSKQLTLSGKIIEKVYKQPLEFATITIINATDQKTITGGITNAEGSFAIEVSPGKYHIKVEYISFKSYHINNITIDADHTLNTIELEEDNEQLAEVTIVSEKTTVEYKLDKKVFNVGKDLIHKGGTISDVLDNVPSVSVDAAGGVSLRGNPSVRILINGKPSVLTANNGLEQIPAENIEKVEVITNPSARYESEGAAGIINIILKKNKRSGFGGSLQFTSGIPANHNANVNLNYKTEKINVFANLGYRYANFFGEEQQTQTTQIGPITNSVNLNADTKRNDDNYNIYFGGDYYINDKNTLTASFYHNKLKNTDETDFIYTYLNTNKETDSILSRKEDYKEPQNFNQLEINYVKTFDKKGQKFTANVQYDFWNDDENEMITQQRIFPTEGNLSRIRTRDVESSKDLLILSDFISPLTEKSRLETGLRAEIRRITSDYTAWIDDQILEGFDNRLDYDERIYGAYMQYGNNRKKFNYLLGARLEHSDIGISDREALFSNTKKYTDIFPTTHLTYNFTERTNLQLSYSRRINRPRFWQLNPFGGLSDPRDLFAGNPDLNPAYANILELALLKRWTKITLNPSIYYQYHTDFFQFITSPTAEGGFITTPVNLSREKRLGFELATTYNPFKWWRLSGEFNYYTFTQEGTHENINYDTEDTKWSTRVNSRMKFSKGFSIQTNFTYQGKSNSGQRLIKSQYWANFGISKDLFKDKVSLTLNANNIFDSRIDKSTVTGQNYNLVSSTIRSGRRVTATLTYRFNRKKSDRDRLPD
ncbi:outer membrane receptor protein involved in Fe transport [Aquimarina sp. EL_43]|uniref:outer membrane beta-barrel family protein n=1 Tax=unclassified Aquimarina TaxID=2627091 RepID=UPI0018CBDBB1|nr:MULTISPECIES: outer membrane beta-barrel family protein [unclassified Aquimarina]MBG6129834.1 outer membrane receptor protein involved in Fe transport [Aquimarina sp. EL_35]MBG6150899.1 outer membrane receptor protein involved in Fe transport [Aquimarina sp. EL_32]MBG6167794.1 outer membrane receptor protein involved in Fe transport [Aquimarina sp. EL_43]